jgi:hypothetical protein
MQQRGGSANVLADLLFRHQRVDINSQHGLHFREMLGQCRRQMLRLRNQQGGRGPVRILGCRRKFRAETPATRLDQLKTFVRESYAERKGIPAHWPPSGTKAVGKLPQPPKEFALVSSLRVPPAVPRVSLHREGDCGGIRNSSRVVEYLSGAQINYFTNVSCSVRRSKFPNDA